MKPRLPQVTEKSSSCTAAVFAIKEETEKQGEWLKSCFIQLTMWQIINDRLQTFWLDHKPA